LRASVRHAAAPWVVRAIGFDASEERRTYASVVKADGLDAGEEHRLSRIGARGMRLICDRTHTIRMIPDGSLWSLRGMISFTERVDTATLKLLGYYSNKYSPDRC
jgi:hypothetical protein